MVGLRLPPAPPLYGAEDRQTFAGFRSGRATAGRGPDRSPLLLQPGGPPAGSPLGLARGPDLPPPSGVGPGALPFPVLRMYEERPPAPPTTFPGLFSETFCRPGI